jgi:resuscitation-promoting factor RpfB
VRPSRGSRVFPGMTIQYRRALDITVVHDDQTERVVTNATTVRQVVKELGIKLRGRDRVEPSMEQAPAAGMTIRVLRIGYHMETKRIALTYDTVLRRDRHLEYGKRRVVQEGRTGLRVVRYRAKYVDGKRVARTTLSVKQVRSPRARIIAIGGGFPGCVCDDGTSYGKATWYSQADGLSAAHRTLPMGTVVRVVNLANGRYVNVVIRDRGPYGDERIIDLSDEAFGRIASLSTGVIRVKIYW